MENTSKPRCSMYHDAIRTQHVFLEDDQLYLKKDNAHMGQAGYETDEWFPINFQWIPVVQLKKKLHH